METSNNSKLFWVGLFVSFGIALFVGTILYFTNENIDSEYKITVAFQQADIESGSKIIMLDQEIGKVSQVSLSDNPRRVLVELSIYEKLIDQGDVTIPDDSRFTIKSELLGPTYVEIAPGISSQSISLNTNKIIEGAIPIKDDVIADQLPFINDVASLSRKLNNSFDEKAVKSVQSSLSNIDTVTNEFKNIISSDNMNQIFKNLEIFSNNLIDISSDIGNEVQPKVARLDSILNQIDQFSIELKQLSQNLNQEMSPKIDKIDSILLKIDQFSNNLNSTKVGFDSFVSSANHLDSSMKIMQDLVTDIQKGKGSLGKFLTDDTLYENVNDVAIAAENVINDFQDNPGKYLKSIFESK